MSRYTRIAKVTVYLEQDLYVLGTVEAKADDMSMSAWLRKLVFDRLRENGKLTQETVLKMAAA